MNRPFFDGSTVRVVHGSLDSVDEDVVYLSSSRTHRLPDGREFVAFCKAHPQEDVNFALVDEDHVQDVLRGLPSELNNALLENPRTAVPGQPVLQRVRRSACEKLLDTLQRAAVLMRRAPAYRDEAIAALRSNSAAGMLRLALRVEWGGEAAGLDADAAKQAAFMMGQAEALLEGAELYDKAGLAGRCPEVAAVLGRRGGREGLSAAAARLWRRVESEARLAQHGPWALCRLPAETALCRFEKNRTRLVVLAAPGARFLRWGEGGSVLRLQPLDWKARPPPLPPQQSPAESFDEDGNLMTEKKE